MCVIEHRCRCYSSCSAADVCCCQRFKPATFLCPSALHPGCSDADQRSCKSCRFLNGLWCEDAGGSNRVKCDLPWCAVSGRSPVCSSRVTQAPSETTEPAQSLPEDSTENTGGRHLYCLHNERKTRFQTLRLQNKCKESLQCRIIENIDQQISPQTSQFLIEMLLNRYSENNIKLRDFYSIRH